MKPAPSLFFRGSLGLLATLALSSAAAAPPPDPHPVLSLPATPEALHLRLPTVPLPDRERAAAMDLTEEGSTTRSEPTLRVPAIGPDGLPLAHAHEWVTTIHPRTTAPATRRFRLGPASNPTADDRPFRFDDVDPQSLGLWEGNTPVFVYRHGVIRPDGIPADRARSTYIHPLYGLDGEVLTDDFPADHHHHRGLFWAWPHVGVRGRTNDLWALNGIEQRFERWLSRNASAAGAVLGVENGWYVGDRKVMTERLWFTVHPATQDRRAIDLDAYWIPTTDPVSLAGAEGKSYGGLTLRYAPRKNTVITTPLGNGTNDLYITRLPWADLSAQFQNTPQPSGAALFVAPDHPDFAPTWLTRHYGVLCLGWPGVQARTFQPGAPIRCRYRVWTHRGSPTQTDLASAYHAYTNHLAPTWSTPTPAKPRLEAVQYPDRVAVFVQGRLFTEYQYPADAKLPHFHPVVGPLSQRSITAKAADPYPHHASLWFGCDRVNGGNYWQEGLDRGRIRSEHVELLHRDTSGDAIVLRQAGVWERPGAEPPFRDHRTIRITAPSPTRRVIDFDITLTALTDVRIEKSNHSLFSARMAPDLAVTGGGQLFNNSGDLGEKATFGQRALWMDARGPRTEATEGLTLFPHPTNPGHPVPWFTRDYGFLSPTPMFWLKTEEHRMAQGDTVRLRYRVLVHADAPPPDELDALAASWGAHATGAEGDGP